jgi:hypothetical protein
MKLTLLVGIVSAMVAGLVGWTINGWRLEAKIDQMVAAHSTQLATANAQALARYTEMERNKQNAIDQANKIAQANAVAAASARSERDRLREQIATSNTGLSTATLASTRAYSTTLTTILNECSEQLEALAKDADGHALDSRTLRGAWPK